MNTNRTERVELRAAQKANLEALRTNFKLSDAELNRCIFFNQDEPWIPPDVSLAIARQIPSIRHIAPAYEKFVPELDQVVFSATVMDVNDRSFTRIGVATRGEQPNGMDIDATELAEGRALNKALNAAGVNPFKAGSAAPIERRPETPAAPPLSEDVKKYFHVTDESVQRTKELKQIHVTADRVGLIVGKDLRRYRGWLEANFGTRTAAVLSAEQRAQVINKLDLFDVDQSFVGGLPMEYQEDALIA